MYQISNEKFGLFVTELRKKKNLTQKDLAEKLYVSDKTVSKWERGLSMPNVVLLIPIADILDVTVTELLRGEKIDTQKNIDTKEVEELVVALSIWLLGILFISIEKLDISIFVMFFYIYYRNYYVSCIWKFIS